MSTRFVLETTLIAALCLGGCRDFSQAPVRESSDKPDRQQTGDVSEFDSSVGPTREGGAEASPIDAGFARDDTNAGQVDPESDGEPKSENGATSDGGVASNDGEAPFDWSSALDALYTFEDGGDLGGDSSGHGLHLSVVGEVELSKEHAQGASAAYFEYDSHSGLWSNDVSFRTFPGMSLSVGTWLKASVTQGDYLVFFNGGQVPGGFNLSVGVGTSTVSCVIGDGTGEYAFAGSGQISNFQDWTHVACRYDHEAGTTQLFVNGIALPAVETPAGIAQGSGRLSLGEGFEGHLDEAFFVHRALSDAQIIRIWACGVDGTKCACSESDPSAYANCGLFGACGPFTMLPACNSEPPSE